MKRFILSFISLTLLALISNQVHAENHEPASADLPNLLPPDAVPAVKALAPYELPDTPVLQKAEKSRYDKIQEINFQLFDSLQNAYSFYSFRQQPFMFEPQRGLLMTLKRGSQSREEPTIDILDNLFLRASTDWGESWGEPINVYNSDDQGLGWARYPSLYPFLDQDDKYYIIYTAPMTSPNPDPDWGWLGFLNGIYVEESNEYNLFTGSFNKNTESGPVELRWGTDAALVAGFDDNELPYGLAIGGVRPPTGTPRDENSNIAYRKPDETFSDWIPVIPDEWASDKYFINTEEDNAGYSSINGLDFAEGNKMVMAALAVFGDVIDGNWPVYAISESDDYGENWTEYDIMPKEMVTQYAEDNGAWFPEAVRLTFGGFSGTGQSYTISRDMCVLPNGDVSFLCLLQDYLTEEQAEQVPDDERFSKIVEIYRENGNWGIREITDFPSFFLLYRNAEGEMHNQMVFEFQISRTIDGKYLIAKWIQLFEWDVPGVDDPVTSTDIMFAVREVGSGDWSRVVKLTDDVYVDRITWLPNLVPNDLMNIPLIKVETKPDPNISEDDVVAQRNNQLELEIPQHVYIGHFDASIALSVEENEKHEASAKINHISPNPAGGEAVATITVPQSGHASLEVFDLMGRKVMTLHEGSIAGGMHALRFNAAGLTAGSYYCVLSCSGERTTKMFSVVR